MSDKNLSESISLPFDCKICKHHLNENEIECQTFKDKFVLPHEGIKEKTRCKQKIENSDHLSGMEKNLKKNFHKTLKLVEGLYDQYMTNIFLDQLNLMIYTHLASINLKKRLIKGVLSPKI